MSEKPRWLWQSFILSIILNVMQLGLFFYFIIRDSPLHFSYKPPKPQVLSCAPCSLNFFSRLQTLSFKELLELLEDDREIKQSWTIRDFALGTLVSHHFFDIKKALDHRFLVEQKWLFEEKPFLLYPRVSESDFKKIKAFAKNEKWPFTTEGLFHFIRENQTDNELLHYFCHTPEFLLIESFFARQNLSMQRRELLTLVIEAGWPVFSNFYESQVKEQNFSKKICRNFLLECMNQKSNMAAYIFIRWDEEYICHHLEEDKLLLLLQLIEANKLMNFLNHLLSINTEGKIHEMVRKKLKEEDKELTGRIATPLPIEKNLRPLFRDQPPAAPSPQTHIILPGETLWLISKKYGVPIEKLMQINHLQSTLIQPGKTLRIP